MKFDRIKNYFINKDNISYIEIGQQKCYNQDEIDNFNKCFNSKIVELYGNRWMYDLRFEVDSNNFGIASLYSYYDVINSDNQYLKQKFFEKFRQKIFDEMNEPVPEKKYKCEYIIHFVGGDIIRDTFTSDELNLLGVPIDVVDRNESDDIIKTFLNFE